MAAVFVLGQAWQNVKHNSLSSKNNFYKLALSSRNWLKPCLTSFPSPIGSGLKSDCTGNLMRLSLDEALAVGNQLEVEAISKYKRSVVGTSTH